MVAEANGTATARLDTGAGQVELSPASLCRTARATTPAG